MRTVMLPSDWIQGFAGGMLIGAGAIVLMLFNGRIAGISGITASALTQLKQSSWRWAFLAGLIAAPLVTALAGFKLPESIPASLPMMAVAGLLVGIGTRIGSGCTSGHGICGLSRWSLRSLFATLIFMGTAVLTVSVVRHLV
ncbi:YeeE/YedE family protein [Salinimonas marina]|uniref:YeeE/YedE family protein n=2 Tax=Salinimonas marina TaxID=2785918 RepID=A0A7S9HBX6_9ALTE|nr:YeeE/YedE family protein [Salinimonas marina]